MKKIRTAVDIVERLQNIVVPFHVAPSIGEAWLTIQHLRSRVTQLEDEIERLRDENERLSFLAQYPPLYEELRAIIDGGSESMDHGQAVAELKRVIEENESLRKDAERYQFMRELAKADPKMDGKHLWYFSLFRLRGETLDAAIDNAMKGE